MAHVLIIHRTITLILVFQNIYRTTSKPYSLMKVIRKFNQSKTLLNDLPPSVSRLHFGQTTKTSHTVNYRLEQGNIRFSIFVTSRRQDIILLFNSTYTRLGFPVEDLPTFTQSRERYFPTIHHGYSRYARQPKRTINYNAPPLVKILIALGITFYAILNSLFIQPIKLINSLKPGSHKIVKQSQTV